MGERGGVKGRRGASKGASKGLRRGGGLRRGLRRRGREGVDPTRKPCIKRVTSEDWGERKAEVKEYCARCCDDVRKHRTFKERVEEQRARGLAREAWTEQGMGV